MQAYAINHDVTEEQLHEARLAIIAVQRQKGHDEISAKSTADSLIWLVFRNVITFDSLKKTIVSNAERVFSH